MPMSSATQCWAGVVTMRMAHGPCQRHHHKKVNEMSLSWTWDACVVAEGVKMARLSAAVREACLHWRNPVEPYNPVMDVLCTARTISWQQQNSLHYLHQATK